MSKYMVEKAIQDLNDNRIVGYELIFQGSKEDFYDRADNSTEDTIYTFLVQNMGKVLHEKPVFLTFTPSLLFRNTPHMFGNDKLVIQIEENLIIHPLALPIIKKFKAEGYRFAISNFQFNPKYFSMLEYADYIRVELTDAIREKGKALDSLDNVMRMAQGFHKKCIVANVNSREDYDLALRLKADYAEGGYVAENCVTKVNKLDYLKGNFFQLVTEVSKDEPDVEVIEQIISRDAGLTYSLLKMVNSTYFALRKKTTSIRFALVTLGIGRMREWVYMLSLSANDEDASAEEILKMSFLRATFMQELAKRGYGLGITPSEAYMMGMFSSFVYMVDATMEEILQELPVSDVIKNALLKKEGKPGMLYSLVLAYEKADWKESRAMAEELGMENIDLVQLYVDCVEKVNQIWTALTSEYREE